MCQFQAGKVMCQAEFPQKAGLKGRQWGEWPELAAGGSGALSVGRSGSSIVRAGFWVLLD